jgi:hypothetical protein
VPGASHIASQLDNEFEPRKHAFIAASESGEGKVEQEWTGLNGSGLRCRKRSPVPLRNEEMKGFQAPTKPLDFHVALQPQASRPHYVVSTAIDGDQLRSTVINGKSSMQEELPN